MSQVYFAAPLFTKGEQLYNEVLIKQLRQTYPEVTFYLPQEQGEINDKNQYADAKQIATYDTNALLNSKVLIALLDGQTIDAGVASEIGIAFANKIPIVGLYTDSRQLGADNSQKIAALKEVGESQFPYVNLYTVGLIKLNGLLVSKETDLIQGLKQYL